MHVLETLLQIWRCLLSFPLTDEGMLCSRNVAGKRHHCIFYHKIKRPNSEVLSKYLFSFQYGKLPIGEPRKVSGTWKEV